jgi:hypothetical protein
MLIDHIGLVFYPEMVLFRAVGRLAFPLFAYQVTTGLMHTSDTGRYASRLFFFAVLSQLPYILLLQTAELNVLFTFAFAVLIVHLLERKYYWQFCIIFSAIISIYFSLSFDYGFYGIITVIGLYVIRGKYPGDLVFSVFFTVVTFYGAYQYGQLQVLSFFAVPFFYFRDELRFLKMKYFYYAFYPGHLSLLLILSSLR